MMGMVKRLLVIGVIQLVLFELTLQFCVHKRESTEELLTIALMVAVFVGVIWIVMAGFRASKHPALWRTLAVLPLFALIYNVDYFYSWRVRPHLSFYRQPDWVAQHDAFQKELQRAIDEGTK